MYAIICDGGRQYKVEEGQELSIDYRGLSAGEEVKFDRVLAYNNGVETKIGQPVLAGISVTAQVVSTDQGDKIVIQKFRRRKNSRRRTGHRQLHTTVKIGKIAV